MNYKRIIALVLAVCCLCAVFTGCKKETVSNGDVKEVEFFYYDAAAPYNAEAPVWKYAEGKTGLKLKSVVSDAISSESAAYSTMLAAGELPEIIATSALNLRDLAADGGLIALDDLIEEHAPNLKVFFEQYPEARKYAGNGDGKIYFIPTSISGMEKAPSNVFFIRQDWLDKLGLKTPTTIQEYHDVLLAFKTQDPNGNGKADEIPYFARAKSVATLVELFGIQSTHTVDRNGNYAYGPAREEYKTAMKELAKWYKEGLIDPEIFTRNSPREQLFGQNLAGATIDWIQSTTAFNDTLKDAVPGFNLVAMIPPKNVYGEAKTLSAQSEFNGRGWGISAHAKKEDLIDLIKYFDFWMSEEGRDLTSYGVEGDTYTKDKDGNIVWSEKTLAHENGVYDYLCSIGAITFIGTVRRPDVATLTMNESGKAAQEMYMDVLPEHQLPSLNFTQEESDAIARTDVNIATVVKEYAQKWLFGKADVDATWDEYMKKMNSMGLQDLIGAYTSAYERMR